MAPGQLHAPSPPSAAYKLLVPYKTATAACGFHGLLKQGVEMGVSLNHTDQHIVSVSYLLYTHVVMKHKDVLRIGIATCLPSDHCQTCQKFSNNYVTLGWT